MICTKCGIPLPADDLKAMPLKRQDFPVGCDALWRQGGSSNHYIVHVVQHLGARSLKVVVREVVQAIAEDGQRALAEGDWTYILPRNLEQTTVAPELCSITAARHGGPTSAHPIFSKYAG